MNQREKRLLRLAADRAARRPALLGWVLSRYVSSQGTSYTALTAELGCNEAAMWRLALCLRPRSDRFAEDVAMIASKLSVDAAALARVIRHVQAIDVMSGRGVAERGALMAARSRRAEDQEKEPDEPSH